MKSIYRRCVINDCSLIRKISLPGCNVEVIDSSGLRAMKERM